MQKEVIVIAISKLNCPWFGFSFEYMGCIDVERTVLCVCATFLARSIRPVTSGRQTTKVWGVRQGVILMHNLRDPKSIKAM